MNGLSKAEAQARLAFYGLNTIQEKHNRVLEEQVIPEFYQRDERGILEKWVTRIRNSMATPAPEFSSNQILRDYAENYYLPASSYFRQRIENQAAIAKELADWQ